MKSLFEPGSAADIKKRIELLGPASERQWGAMNVRKPEPFMMTGSTCDCLVCQLEKSLIAELGEERNLLIQFKVEGISCQELASRNGHSAIAIQHRIQRSLDRLRRLAKSPPGPVAKQLELFPL
jgi:hypothetical protein